MANEQQALLLVLRSIEGFLPDLVPLGSPWLPHKAVEMDVSPGKLSAPITEQFSVTLLWLPVCPVSD
jgi:hypothetical protein